MDTLTENASVVISDNNTINGKKFLIINGGSNLKKDCSDIGQIILLNSCNLELNNLKILNINRGIYVKNCSYLSINNGTIYDTRYGIDFIECHKSEIFNLIIESSENGITGRLTDSVIDNCTFSNITGFGLMVSEFTNSYIINSMFENCESGIDIHYFRDSNWINTTISNCYLDHCNLGIMINIGSGVINKSLTITDNIFERTVDHAIYLYDNCRNIGIYRNVMLFNGGSNSIYNSSRMQVMDKGSGNQWYDSDGTGNYWSDWQLADDDEDGIVDSPMPINTYRDIFDLYPISMKNSSLIPPPGNVRSTTGFRSIDISWEKPARNPYIDPYHFTLYRSEAGSPYEVVTVLDENVLCYRDDTVKEAVYYSYYLVSNNSLGYGRPSEIVTSMVDSEPPVLDILSPFDGFLFNVSNVTVEWKVTDPGGMGKVELALNGSGDWIDVTSKSFHTFFILPDGSHHVSIRAVDLIGNVVQKNVSFLVDTTPPGIELTWSNQDRISQKGVLDVFWNCSDAVSGLEGIRIEFDDSLEYLVEPVGSMELEYLGHGHHSFRISAVDLAGNYYSMTETFLIDQTAPNLEILSPISGTITNENEVTIEWSCNDVDANVLFIRGSLDGVEIFNLSWMIEEFELVLEDGYHVIGLTACDGAGNHVSESVNITVDTVAPSILSFGPVGSDVNVSEPIWVIFSEPLSPGAGIITVRNVEGVSFWEGYKLIFEPYDDLIPGRNYSVNVNGVDLAGNSIDHSWTFRTLEEALDDDDNEPVEDNHLEIIIICICAVLLLLMIGISFYVYRIKKKKPFVIGETEGVDLDTSNESIEE